MFHRNLCMLRVRYGTSLLSLDVCTDHQFQPRGAHCFRRGQKILSRNTCIEYRVCPKKGVKVVQRNTQSTPERNSRWQINTEISSTLSSFSKNSVKVSGPMTTKLHFTTNKNFKDKSTEKIHRIQLKPFRFRTSVLKSSNFFLVLSYNIYLKRLRKRTYINLTIIEVVFPLPLSYTECLCRKWSKNCFYTGRNFLDDLRFKTKKVTEKLGSTSEAEFTTTSSTKSGTFNTF